MEAPDVHYARSGDVAVAYQAAQAIIGGVHELKGVPGEWRLHAVSGT